MQRRSKRFVYAHLCGHLQSYFQSQAAVKRKVGKIDTDSADEVVNPDTSEKEGKEQRGGPR